MRWSKLELLRASEHTITFDDSLSFDASAFSAMNQIRGLNDVRVSGKLRYDSDEDRVFADIEISGRMYRMSLKRPQLRCLLLRNQMMMFTRQRAMS